MKLTLKTLKGQMIHVQVEPETPIGQVKQKIKEQKGFDVDSQKIVFKGKPANDGDTVQSLGIKETDFLVVMTIIKKPEPKPKQQTAAKQQKKQQSKTVPKPKESTQVKQQQKPSSDTQAKINQLMGMGFDRQKCSAALRAAFNNTDVAIDYLINGIPSDVGGQEVRSQNVEDILRTLMSTPQFAPVREMLRNDPTQLNLVMEQIMATSPGLYNMIAENPQAFQRVLTQQYDEEEGDDYMEDEGQQDQQQEGGHINISPQQDAAIKRLMALGFSQIDAAQAYFACDKNEQLAANLLFDRMANGDLDQQIGFGNQGNNQSNMDDQDDDNLFN